MIEILQTKGWIQHRAISRDGVCLMAACGMTPYKKYMHTVSYLQSLCRRHYGNSSIAFVNDGLMHSIEDPILLLKKGIYELEQSVFDDT